MKYVLLVTVALLLALGQILFKKAALAGNAAGLVAVLLNPWTVAALVVYAAATALYLQVLRETPLSLAYPFIALGFVFVPVAAWSLLGEALHWRHLAGAGLIIAGIALAAR